MAEISAIGEAVNLCSPQVVHNDLYRQAVDPTVGGFRYVRYPARFGDGYDDERDMKIPSI